MPVPARDFMAQVSPESVVLERLQAVKDIPLSVGAAPPPGEGCKPGAFCALQKLAWVTGERWTDHPDNCDPAIGAFIRRYQDSIDQAGRDALDQWMFDPVNLDRLLATANDGHTEQRGYIAADWAVHTMMPIWLELAGATEAAEEVRALPRIIDAATASEAYDGTRSIGDEMRARRDRAIAKFRVAFRKEWDRIIEEKKAAWAAWAAGAAWAAWAAGAAWAAWAAGAAGAAGAAWAAEAASLSWSEFRRIVRRAVADTLRPKFEAALAEKDLPVKQSVIEVLERMVTVGHEA